MTSSGHSSSSASSNASWAIWRNSARFSLRTLIFSTQEINVPSSRRHTGGSYSGLGFIGVWAWTGRTHRAMREEIQCGSDSNHQPRVALYSRDSGNLQMITVRLHVDNGGNIWLLARCRACNNVHKYPAAQVSARPVNCK